MSAHKNMDLDIYQLVLVILGSHKRSLKKSSVMCSLLARLLVVGERLVIISHVLIIDDEVIIKLIEQYVFLLENIL